MTACAEKFRCSLCLLLAGTALAVPAPAQGTYRNRDNPNLGDTGDGIYPIPYQLPTVTDVTTIIDRIRAYVDEASPTRVIDTATGKEITDFTQPVATAAAAPGAGGEFGPWSYPMGVICAAMLRAAAVTGDPRYAEFTRRHVQFIGDRLPYFRRQAELFPVERGGDSRGPGPRRNSFKGAILTESLDDSGAMGAALVKARLAGVGPDLRPLIDRLADFVAHQQFRLPDGAWARHRPQPVSLWADDYYMSVPFMAQMTRLTGDPRYVNDAARHVLVASERLFNRRMQLFVHGWNANQPYNPPFYWGRANGWVMMAIVELLDVLPADHPDRPKILDLLQLHMQGVAPLQSPDGLWHNLLDKADSYEETSCTAMFIYSMAHAINEGWISPVSYGSVVQAAWNGLSTKVNARGQVLDTCVGTTFAADNVYYYHRPTSPDSSLGVGSALLAGSEMIRLLQNPRIEIRKQWRTYHYIPK